MILPFSVRRDWKHQGLQAELAKAQGLPLPSTPLPSTSSRDQRQVQRELDASQRELQLVTIQAKDQAEQLEHDRSMQQNLLLGKHRLYGEEISSAFGLRSSRSGRSRRSSTSRSRSRSRSSSSSSSSTSSSSSSSISRSCRRRSAKKGHR